VVARGSDNLVHEHRWDASEENLGFHFNSLWVILGKIDVAAAGHLVGVRGSSPPPKVLSHARHSRECGTVTLAIRPHLVGGVLPAIFLPEVRLRLATTKGDLEAFALVVAISSESMDDAGRVTDVECDGYCLNLVWDWCWCWSGSLDAVLVEGHSRVWRVLCGSVAIVVVSG